MWVILKASLDLILFLFYFFYIFNFKTNTSVELNKLPVLSFLANWIFNLFCRFRKCVSFRRFKQTDSIFLFPPKKNVYSKVFFSSFSFSSLHNQRAFCSHNFHSPLSLFFELSLPISSQHTKQTTAKRKKKNFKN